MCSWKSSPAACTKPSTRPKLSRCFSQHSARGSVPGNSSVTAASFGRRRWASAFAARPQGVMGFVGLPEFDSSVSSARFRMLASRPSARIRTVSPSTTRTTVPSTVVPKNIRLPPRINVCRRITRRTLSPSQSSQGVARRVHRDPSDIAPVVDDGSSAGPVTRMLPLARSEISDLFPSRGPTAEGGGGVSRNA